MSEDEVKRLEKWIEQISWIIMMLLEGLDEGSAFDCYEATRGI